MSGVQNIIEAAVAGGDLPTMRPNGKPPKVLPDVVESVLREAEIQQRRERIKTSLLPRYQVGQAVEIWRPGEQRWTIATVTGYRSGGDYYQVELPDGQKRLPDAGWMRAPQNGAEHTPPVEKPAPRAVSNLTLLVDTDARVASRVAVFLAEWERDHPLLSRSVNARVEVWLAKSVAEGGTTPPWFLIARESYRGWWRTPEEYPLLKFRVIQARWAAALRIDYVKEPPAFVPEQNAIVDRPRSESVQSAVTDEVVEALPEMPAVLRVRALREWAVEHGRFRPLAKLNELTEHIAAHVKQYGVMPNEIRLPDKWGKHQPKSFRYEDTEIRIIYTPQVKLNLCWVGQANERS